MRRTCIDHVVAIRIGPTGDRGIRSDIGARSLFQGMAVRFPDTACERPGKTQFAMPTCMDSWRLDMTEPRAFVW